MANDYISQVTLPNNTTYDFQASYLNKVTRSLVVTGSGTAGSYTNSTYYPAKWTFNTGNTATDGDIITIKIPVAGHDYGVFMSIDNGSHYYPVVLNGTDRITSHFPVNTYITVIFEPTGSAASMFALAGQTSSTRITVTGGVWRVLNYRDTNNNDMGYYHRRIYPNLKAGGAIHPYSIIMQLPNGRWSSITTTAPNNPVSGTISPKETGKAASTNGYMPGHVLLMYARATYADGNDIGTYNIWSAHSGLIDARYSFNLANSSGNGFTRYTPVYIVGTITDGLFYLDTTRWWTLTLPTSDDGKVYIYIGDAYDWYRLTFTEEKPIYWYKDGAIRLYSGASEYALSAPLSGISDADDLKAIEAISGTTGLLKKTAANTWTLDTKSYVTSSGVTKVSTGAGLTGGDITTTGTVKANLTSDTKLTNAAADGTETSGRVYPVRLDKNGKLAVNVPWTNVNSSYLTTHNNLVTQTISSDNADYRILLSGTADDTTRAEGTRKDTDFYYNPSTNLLHVDNLDLKAGFKIRHTTIPAHTWANAELWWKIAQVTGYFNIDIYITGTWSSCRPTVAVINVLNMQGTVKITQKSGYISDVIGTVIKLGKVETNKWDVLIYTEGYTSGSMGLQEYWFYGYGAIDTYQPTTADTTTYSASSTLALKDISGVTVSTDNSTSGDANGQIKLAGKNISVTGLGSLAYKSSLTYSDVGALASTTKYAASSSVGGAATNATTTANTTDSIYPVGVKSGATTTLLHNTSITMTGGTVSATKFHATHTAGGLLEFRVTYGSTIDMSFMVGTANENHGIYDSKKAEWVLVAGASNTWNLNGNADTATSAGKWTTARTLTIGNKSQSVDGSGNVSWSLADIGAAPAVSGGYLPLSGGDMTGAINLKGADLNLKSSGTGNDAADLVWWYGNGKELARIWMAAGGDNKWAPLYRCYKSDGTSLYNGHLVLGDGTGASGTWGISISGTAAKATADANGYNLNDTYAKSYILVIDLTADDITKWYPVTIQLPANGLQRVACVTELNSGHKPSWSEHRAGYTAVVEIRAVAGGWGTTGAYSMCLVDDLRHLNTGEAKPIGYTLSTNSSRATFWCRGGAKYRLLSDFFGSWTTYKTDTTVSSLVIGPKSSNPGISFTSATITANLNGNAASATKVYVTNTTPASATIYYLAYTNSTTSGNQDLRNTARLYYYDTGTSSYLNIGNASNEGGLTLHNSNGKYADIITSAFSAHRTITLPDATGTIALTSDIPTWSSLGGGDSGKHADSYFVKTITSTDNAIPRFDGTSGLILNSTAIINDAGTMTIKGKLIVNPSYDTTVNGYNEGIRINVASNGWANVHFGGSNDSTSNTGDGLWLVGRRGAVGSTFGAVGDFTIEEEGSTGKGLTLHKDSGGMVLYTSLVQDKPLLKINNAGTIAAGKFGWAINAVSTMAATSNSLLLVGAASSSKNQAYLGFHYEGSSSNSNYLTLGLFGADHLLTIYPTGLTKITKNIASSSTTTGSLIVAGGVGIGEKLYVADEAHAEKYIIDEHVTLQYNTTDSSLEFVFA